METGRDSDQRGGCGAAVAGWQDWPARPEWRLAVERLRWLGRRTGREHAITLLPTGRPVGGTRHGDRHVVNVGRDVLDRLDTPGEELAVCHTHPAQPGEPPNELSAPDLVMLGRAGVRSLHMVSPYEPGGYSIAHRALDVDPAAWRAIVGRARDVAFDLVSAAGAAAYRRANGLARLDHQRVLVRALDFTGLIAWQRRFDGATAELERRHGPYFDELAQAACATLAAALQSDGVTWVDAGNPGILNVRG